MIVVSRRATAMTERIGIPSENLAELMEADYLVQRPIRSGTGAPILNIELIAHPSGSVLWVGDYGLPESDADIFRAQLEIANEVARVLGGKRGHISAIELTDCEAKANRSAYQCVLRYIAYQSRRSLEKHKVIRYCLEQSTISALEYSEVGVVLHRPIWMNCETHSIRAQIFMTLWNAPTMLQKIAVELARQVHRTTLCLLPSNSSGAIWTHSKQRAEKP